MPVYLERIVERVLKAYVNHRSSEDETFIAFAKRTEIDDLKARLGAFGLGGTAMGGYQPVGAMLPAIQKSAGCGEVRALLPLQLRCLGLRPRQLHLHRSPARLAARTH